jgi:hypothetical protein
MMLEVMREVRNFFDVSVERREFVLSKGKISLSGKYEVGQYILLTGSLLVNGVYRVAAVSRGRYTLDLPTGQAGGAEIDEKWAGIVYGLAVPPEFVKLCEEIQKFDESSGNNNIVSETVIGVHSWTRATRTDGSRAKGVPVTWRDMYADRLNHYRRMFSGVKV